jgi:hypothetical protein
MEYEWTPVTHTEDTHLDIVIELKPSEIDTPAAGTIVDIPLDNSPPPGLSAFVASELTDAEIEARIRVGLTDEAIKHLLEEQRGKYYFDRLSIHEQRLYVELLQIIKAYAFKTIVSSLSTAEIDKVFQCVSNDHPEIFYTHGYYTTSYTLDDVVKKIAFAASYTVGTNERDRRQRYIDAYVRECLQGMPIGADDYQKVKYVYEYIIQNTEYDLTSLDNQNICSVFLYGRSVCQGYAKATQYLLNAVGVPTTLVTGWAIDGERHAWNLVIVDGEFYHVDSTFGDSSYNPASDYPHDPDTANQWRESVMSLNYDFLLITTAQLERTHIIEAIVPIERATSMRNNYYIREGLWFDAVDEAKLQALFNREIEKGSRYVTLKSADNHVYTAMMDYLIGQQRIFSYLAIVEGVVRYIENEKQYTITFFL